MIRATCLALAPLATSAQGAAAADILVHYAKSQPESLTVAPGATSATLFFENRVVSGVDGITFLDGVLYVNNVVFNKLYRIPVDAAGKPGAPVDIWMDMPIKGPDGVRAGGGKLYQAENGSGRIDALTITGDTAHVTVLKSGLETPTGVEPVGGEVWFTERGTGKVESVAAPK